MNRAWCFDTQDKMQELARELLSRKETYVLPVDTLCRELQLIADQYYYAGHSEAEVGFSGFFFAL